MVKCYIILECKAIIKVLIINKLSYTFLVMQGQESLYITLKAL